MQGFEKDIVITKVKKVNCIAARAAERGGYKMNAQEMDNLSAQLYRFCQQNNQPFFDMSKQMQLGRDETTPEERLLFLTFFREILRIQDSSLKFEFSQFFAIQRVGGFKIQLDSKWGTKLVPDQGKWDAPDGESFWMKAMKIFIEFRPECQTWLFDTLKNLPAKAGLVEISAA